MRRAACVALALSLPGCKGCGQRSPPSPGVASIIVQDFEGSPDIGKWPKDAAGEAAISIEWRADGQRSLKIGPGVMAVLTDLKVHDFSGYTTLVFQVHNPAPEAATLGVEIQDDHTDLRDRHQHTFGAPPGDERIELDFSGGLWRGEENRPYRGTVKTPLDVSKVTRLAFTNLGREAIYIDGIALEQSPRIAAPGAFAFDFGPEGSQVMGQTIGVSPKVRYTPERGYGLLGDHPAALGRSLSYPTPLLGDGLGFNDGGFRVDLEGGDTLGWIAFERGGFWEEESSGYRRTSLAVNGVVVSEHAFSESGPHFFFEDTELTDLSELEARIVRPAAAVQRFSFKAQKGGNTFTLSVDSPRGSPLRVAGLFLAPDTPAGRAFLDAEDALQTKAIRATFTPQDKSRRGEGRAAPEEDLVVLPLPPGAPVYPRDYPARPADAADAARAAQPWGAPLGEILAVPGQPVTVHLAVYATKVLHVHVDAGASRVSVGQYLPMRSALPGPVWIEVSHYRPESDFTVGPELTRSVVIEVPLPERGSGVSTSTITLVSGDIKREVSVRIRLIERQLPEIPIPVGLFMNALPFGPSVVGEATFWRFQEDLLREQGRAGLNCLTGGPGIQHPWNAPAGARDRAEEYLALARRYGPVRAVVPYAGGFLPPLRESHLPPEQLASALSGYSAPHYAYAYDEPATDAEITEALALISPFTRAGVKTLGFTSARSGSPLLDALIGDTYAVALSIHGARDIARWKGLGRHVWVYSNGLSRYGMGLHLWRSIKLGAEGRLEWVGLITQGFAFDNLDGREPAQAAWVVHDKLGPLPTPRWLAAREGLLDLRVRLALEAAVPAGDPALAAWSVEAYGVDQGRWKDEALHAARAAMLERLSRSP